MKLLFTIDTLDYDEKKEIIIRPSVRGIIIKNNKLAMVHSLKYDYYKFPGGGMEKGENQIQTLIRETKEEAGLIIKPDTIKEYGMVKRKDKTLNGGLFLQDNYYYLCEIEDERKKQNLDDYEKDEEFTLEFVSPEVVIETNERYINYNQTNIKNKNMIYREKEICKLLIKEKRLGSSEIVK